MTDRVINYRTLSDVAAALGVGVDTVKVYALPPADATFGALRRRGWLPGTLAAWYDARPVQWREKHPDFAENIYRRTTV